MSSQPFSHVNLLFSRENEATVSLTSWLLGLFCDDCDDSPLSDAVFVDFFVDSSSELGGRDGDFTSSSEW